MTMNIAAIPTTYAGVRFRSRLEARWAATFDILGWDWEYEPFDLNGWIPDFQLSVPKYFSNGIFEGFYGYPNLRIPNPLVEVRPVENQYVCPLKEFGIDRIYKGLGIIPGDFNTYKSCIEILLVGVNPDNMWRIPDLCDWAAEDGFFIDDGKRIWREAGNQVQWKGR